MESLYTPSVFQHILWESWLLFSSSTFTVISLLLLLSLQLWPTLCDPIDVSPPGSHAPGILQARTLEWVAISFCNARKWKVKVKSLSHVRLLASPWTAAYKAPPSMGFSRQEYWSGVPLPSPSNLTSIPQKTNFIMCMVPKMEKLAFHCNKRTIWKFDLGAEKVKEKNVLLQVR